MPLWSEFWSENSRPSGTLVGCLVPHKSDHLQLHGRQYRARVAIPADLRKAFGGKAFLIAPLGTPDLPRRTVGKANTSAASNVRSRKPAIQAILCSMTPGWFAAGRKSAAQ
jgi:hypothetical protein